MLPLVRFTSANEHAQLTSALSGYTVDHLLGDCYSTFDTSDLEVTDICNQQIDIDSWSEVAQTFTIDGTAITRSNVLTWDRDQTISTSYQRTTVGPEFAEGNHLTPVVNYPMITMVHKEGDDDSAESNGEGNDEGGGDGDNAAPGLMDAGVMAAVIGAAGILGVALVL